MPEWLTIFGIPTAITSLGIWWFKKKIDKMEKRQEEREKDLISLILIMMQGTKSNNVGIEAIAKAVQRIPDAKCNGDMKAALAEMQRIQDKENEFLADKGMKYLFE